MLGTIFDTLGVYVETMADLWVVLWIPWNLEIGTSLNGMHYVWLYTETKFLSQ